MSLQTLFKIGKIAGKGLVGSFFGKEKASPDQVIQLSEEERKKRAISFLGAEEYGYPYQGDDAPNILIPEPLVQTQTSFIPSATVVPEVIDAPRGQIVRGLGGIILEIERINRNIANIQKALSDKATIESKYREEVAKGKQEEIAERDKLRSQRRASRRREALFRRTGNAVMGALDINPQQLGGSLLTSGILATIFGIMDFGERLVGDFDNFIEDLRIKLPDIFGDPSGPGGKGSSGKPMDISKIPIDDPEAKAAVALIRRVEGTLGEKGPSTFFGGSQYGGDLTKKTFAEVAALQKKFLAEGYGKFYDKQARKINQSAAVGIGQFLEPENALKTYLGLDPETTMFDEKTQTALIIAIAAKKRGVDLTKPLTKEDIKKLNEEWSGLGPRYGQTTRTIGQSLKIYQDYLKQIGESQKTKTKPQEQASAPVEPPASVNTASAPVRPASSRSGTPSVLDLGPVARAPIVIDARKAQQIAENQQPGAFATQKDIVPLEPRLLNSGHEAMFA